jgi:hypothetical protein
MVFPRLRPYINGLKQRAFGPLAHEAQFSSVEIIHNQSETDFKPVISLPDEPEKVTATIANHDLERHLRFFRHQRITHAPVLRYELRDALVLPNGLSGTQRNMNRAGKLDHEYIFKQPIEHLETASYCLEDRAFFFFGHWLRSFAQCLMADNETPLLHFAPPSWHHAATYEDLFKLKSLPMGLYIVDRLILFQDFAQSFHKAQRYGILRERLQKRIERSSEARNWIYLKRGGTGAPRLIHDEERLEGQLQKLGFDIIDLACTPIDEIHRRCIGAEIAMTIEGSHADHLHWLLKPGGTLWILNPSDHFNTSQFAVAQSMGNHTACSVIEPVENGGAKLDHGSAVVLAVRAA